MAPTATPTPIPDNQPIGAISAGIIAAILAISLILSLLIRLCVRARRRKSPVAEEYALVAPPTPSTPLPQTPSLASASAGLVHRAGSVRAFLNLGKPLSRLDEEPETPTETPTRQPRFSDADRQALIMKTLPPLPPEAEEASGQRHRPFPQLPQLATPRRSETLSTPNTPGRSYTPFSPSELVSMDELRRKSIEKADELD